MINCYLLDFSRLVNINQGLNNKVPKYKEKVETKMVEGPQRANISGHEGAL